MEIKLNESQIDNLVKLVLSEERKKINIIPETWERAPAGKPKDPIGYWKALYDNLKKNGIPVQYQYANDPAKSGYMWWGSWIIWKDLKKNNGYPISFTTPNKNVYLFKFKDGIYRGQQDLSKIILTSECINYTYPMNLSMFKKSQKEVADGLSKDFKTKPKSVFGCMMKITNYQYDLPKSSGTPEKSKNYPYDELKNNPTPEFIAKILKESRGSVNDNEAWAEAAFMAIKNMDMYNKVANALKTDPYKFVRDFINVSIKYHVQAIQVSYLQLLDDKGTTVTKFSTQCPLTFTEQNPGGGKTNKAGQVPYALWNTNKDPYLTVRYFGNEAVYKAKVPEDFGWKLNNNIYPYPTLYSKSCSTTTKINESKVYEQANFDRFKNPNQVKLDPMSTTKEGVRTSQNKSNQKKMIEFNNGLVQQKKLIPQYCTKPLTRVKQKGTRGSVSYAYLSMYSLCKDFGGLWVRGANTANFTCGCRDMNAIDFNIPVDDGSGYVMVDAKTISQSVNKTQTSKNWSNKDNQQLVLNVVALASAFIPVVGPAISAGISLAGAYGQYRQGNNKAAAIELFFAVLPFIGKIPGMAKVSRAMAGSLKVKLVRGGTMTLQEFNTVKQIIAYDTYISSKVGQYLEKQAMNDISKKLLTTVVKKAEAKVVGLAGTPTYGDLKKKAAGETLTVTTGVEDSNEG
jgi:hypothetical protein